MGDPPPGGELLAAAAEARSVREVAALLRDLRRRQARTTGEPVLTYRQLATRTGWSRGIIGEYLTGNVLAPTDRFDDLVQLLGATAREQGVLATARDRAEDAGRERASPKRSATPVIRPRQLPADIPVFAGRVEQSTQIDRLFARPAGEAPGVVVITGPAGMGKTAFAVRTAHARAIDYPDGQLFLNLRGFDPNYRPMTASGGLRKLLEALGVPPAAVPVDVDSRSAMFRDMLSDRAMLIVLDNAIDAAAVRPLLPGGSAHLVLVTSRNQLASLVSLDGANPISMPPLTTAESREVLNRRLFARRAADPGPLDQDADVTAIDEMVLACGGLPLAIVIVGARAAINPEFPLPALAGELSGADGLLGLGRSDATEDLAEVFSWSYRRLSPVAARMFRVLGEHPGPDFSADLVAACVIDEAGGHRRSLTELVSANLLTERAPGRYAFHDLLHQYAKSLAQQNDSLDERAAGLERACAHYVRMGQAAAMALAPQRPPLSPAVDNPPPPMTRTGALAWFGAELTNILAAIAAVRPLARDELLWSLTWLLPHYLDWMGDRQTWVEIGEIALDVARRRGDRSGEALARLYLGNARFRQGDVTLGTQLHRESLAVYEAIGDLRGQASACNTLARSAGETESLDAGIAFAHRAVDLFAALDDQPGLGRGLNGLGAAYLQAGDPASALPICERAQQVLGPLDDRRDEALAWDRIGLAQRELGQFDVAIDAFRKAVDLFAGSPVHLATTLTHLGEAHLRRGDREAALAVWHQAVADLHELSTFEAVELRRRLDGLLTAA